MMVFSAKHELIDINRADRTCNELFFSPGKHSFFVHNTLYYIHPTRVVPVNRGLCYNTRLCTSNSMIFEGCVYIHMGNILYKYGWNRSLDNKFMNLYLEVYKV